MHVLIALVALAAVVALVIAYRNREFIIVLIVVMRFCLSEWWTTDRRS